MTTKKIPLPALGIDLLSRETELPAGTVREAINVDIGRSGTFQRRAGYVQAVAGVDFHSIWRAPQRGWTLVGQGARVMYLDPRTYALTELYGPLALDPISFAEHNGNIYFTNRGGMGYVPANANAARAVGVETPTPPALTSTSSGGLAAGRYGVVLTLMDERGEEGGACSLQTIHVEGGGGIVMSGLPMVPGRQVVIYLTDTDGELLRRAALIPAVFGQYTVAERAQGVECLTQNLAPMPAGDFVRGHAGRLYVAKGSALYFSESLRPHLYDPAHNVMPFTGRIGIFEAVTDGLYVGDSRGVWFLDGNDPTQFKQRLVSSCRAVARSSIMVPPEHFDPKKVQATEPVAVWLSTSGYVVGANNGVTVELQPDRIKVPAGLVGRSLFLLRNGVKQVLTPVNSASTAAYGIAGNSHVS